MNSSQTTGERLASVVANLSIGMLCIRCSIGWVERGGGVRGAEWGIRGRGWGCYRNCSGLLKTVSLNRNTGNCKAEGSKRAAQPLNAIRALPVYLKLFPDFSCHFFQRIKPKQFIIHFCSQL